MYLRLTIILFVLAICLASRAEVRDFQTWKVEKINLALDKVRHSDLGTTKKLSQEQLVGLLELNQARELSMSDYLVNYVVKYDDHEAVLDELSSKLSSEEMAELLLAYSMAFMGDGTIQ